MSSEVSVIRDGRPVSTDVSLIVPGDLIFLRGGQAVPADCLWVEGDTIKVDTAPLTGEPLPWSCPREDEAYSPGSGKVLWAGMTVISGECFATVEYTGLETEIGKAAELVMKNGEQGRAVGFFEAQILQTVRRLILATLVITLAIFVVQVRVRKESVKSSLLVCLSLVIGAVPIALPLVIQVTMAIGATAMARHKAIITHTTALQEIASMEVLCSDKTGTLTTAKMSVLSEKIWTRGGFTKDQALLWAALASNDANLEDPIDSCILEVSPGPRTHGHSHSYVPP